ncbi:MAG TPA: hypothetical protein VH475_27930, partial [Tepidisphaeraceae bacterium]
MKPWEFQALRERVTRRHFFGTCGIGVGKIALASLVLGDRAFANAQGSTSSSPLPRNPLAPKPAH